MNDASIVITGVGPVTPVGLGRAELALALDEGLEPAALGKIPLADYLQAEKTYLDPNSELTLVSASLALRDARLTVTDENAPDVGMSLGTHFGNVTTVESYVRMVREQGVKLASPLLFIHSYPNTSVSLSTMEFLLKGTSFNFNSGRWCGLQALIQAVDELRSGRMSVMLAGASDTYTEVTRQAAVGRTFDAAAAVVTERASGAIGRGIRPLAEVAGSGLAAAAGEALSRALAEAAVGRPEIDWLLLDAPQDALESAVSRAHTTALVPVVGDCGAATAMTGVVLAAVVMAGGKLPGRLGLAETVRTAVVVSADDTGAAALCLRTLAD